MVKNVIFPMISAVLFSAVVASAASAELSKAETAIQNGDCATAMPLLQPLAEKKIHKEDGAKAAELLAHCYVKTNDTANLDRLTSRYLEYYAGNPKRSRMEVIAAERMLHSDSQMVKGVETLLNVLVYSKNGEIKEMAQNLLAQTISKDKRLTISQLTAFADKAVVSKKVSNVTWLRLGRELAEKKNYKAARYWYKKVLVANENEEWVELAKDAMGALEGKSSIPTVLVLAPVSGDFAEFGLDAVKGVRLALEKANLNGKVNLRVADTRADAVEALRRTRQVVAQDSVIAIVGPIMSAPAATVAAWLSSTHSNIPMLTPTATDAGISRMGWNIFQVNVSMDNLATGIANYAVDCLGIREFAVLSPIGDFGTAMTQSFSRAVESRGGVILATQEFEEGRPDYTTEFRKLRAERFDQILHKMNIARGAKNLDAMGSKEKRSFMKDSVFKVPGIFIPSSSPSDAGLIARQVAYHKLDGTLLGTSGWYGQDLIDEGKKLVEGSYFSVSFGNADTNQTYKDFKSAYKAKWNEEPKADKVSGLSYSAASIVFSLIASGETDLVKKIYSQKVFRGVYGDIRFEKGANANVQIMSVDSSAFVNKTVCPSK